MTAAVRLLNPALIPFKCHFFLSEVICALFGRLKLELLLIMKAGNHTVTHYTVCRHNMEDLNYFTYCFHISTASQF